MNSDAVLKIFLMIIHLFLIFPSCIPIKTVDYLKIKPNQIQNYNGCFIKNPNDTSYKKIENLFGSISKSDTFREKTSITFKTTNVDGHIAYYPIQTTRKTGKKVYIGTDYFLHSAIIFDKGVIRLAPVNLLDEIDWLSYIKFEFKIPKKVTKRTQVKIIIKNETIVLSDFKLDSLMLDGKIYPNCLQIKITEIWPETTYTGMVWLSKEYGLLKWIRSTGRIETRIL